MRNKFILSLAILCFYVQASAQVGIGTISPNASSSLEIVSTTKGFLMPRMTAAQRTAIATPATGLLVFQTDPVAGFWYYTGTIWVRLNSTADALSIPSAYAANTSGSSYLVVLGGTDISLPNNQLVSTGITTDGTTFTVAATGRYRIAYSLNTTLSLLMSTRLVINGVGNQASTFAPVLTTTTFANEIIVDLNAGSTVKLQAFGLIGTAILTPNASGASLSIIRLN